MELRSNHVGDTGMARTAPGYQPLRCSNLMMAASFLIALSLWTVLVSVGYSSGQEFRVDAAGETHQPWKEIIPIFLTNASAALGLYAGILTAGIATLAATALLGLFTGAVFHGAVNALGVAGAAHVLLPYFFFEGMGLVLATGAGLLPLVALIHHLAKPETTTVHSAANAYLIGIKCTLVPITLAVALIAVGAVLEVLGGIPL